MSWITENNFNAPIIIHFYRLSSQHHCYTFSSKLYNSSDDFFIWHRYLCRYWNFTCTIINPVTAFIIISIPGAGNKKSIIYIALVLYSSFDWTLNKNTPKGFYCIYDTEWVHRWMNTWPVNTTWLNIYKVLNYSIVESREVFFARKKNIKVLCYSDIITLGYQTH